MLLIKDLQMKRLLLTLTVLLSLSTANASLPNFETMQTAIDYLFSSDVYTKISCRHLDTFDISTVERIQTNLDSQYALPDNLGKRKILNLFKSVFKAITAKNRLVNDRHEIYDPLTSSWSDVNGTTFIIDELHYGMFVSQRSFIFTLNYKTKLRVLLELEGQEGLDPDEYQTSLNVIRRIHDHSEYVNSQSPTRARFL